MKHCQLTKQNVMTELKNTQLMVDVAAFHAVREEMRAYQEQVFQCCKRLDELAGPIIKQLSEGDDPTILVYLNGHPYNLGLLDEKATPMLSAIYLERMQLLVAEPPETFVREQPPLTTES
jgi:hypothetical protein